MKKPAIEEKALQALTDLVERNPFPQNIESVYVPRDLINELVSWIHDSAAEHSRSDEDAEDVLTEMAQRHGVSVRLLLGQEEFERPTNNRDAHEVQRALMLVLPPRYIPPSHVIMDWVGAARVATVKWAEAAHAARIAGEPEPKEMPHDLREYLRWGHGTVLVSCKACVAQRPGLVFIATNGSHYEVLPDGVVFRRGAFGIGREVRSSHGSMPAAIDWILKHQGE